MRTLLLIALLSACQNYAPRGLLVASNAVILCDLSQTLWMADGGRWDHDFYEQNPLLGTQPQPYDHRYDHHGCDLERKL